MGQALVIPNAEVIWCYCCEAFQPHTVFAAEMDEYATFYECNTCGCVVDSDEYEIVRPQDND